MDSFYVSVELLEQPQLKEEVAVVGNQLMVATSNYCARKIGIRSGMPMFVAEAICKELKVKLFKLPVRKHKYKEYAEKVRLVMAKYDPDFEAVGLDEGYLNLTPVFRPRFRDSQLSPEEQNRQIEEFLAQIQNDVEESTQGLGISLGLSFNRYLSKHSSEVNKPKGIYILRRNKRSVHEFLDRFDIGRIKHVGPHKERIFKGLGKQ
jgi:DNA polymerase kappa